MKQENTVNRITHRKSFGALCAVYIPIFLFFIFCLIPFICVVSGSISSSDRLYEEGIALLPRGFSLDAYRVIFRFPEDIIRSYLTSIFIVVVGTVLNVYLTISVAYPLSKMDFKYNRIISFLLFFTVIFSGGLIPTYILFSQYLHIYNTIWVLILPGLVNVGHIVFLRMFFQQVSPGFYESARLEGANEWKIMMKIATPLVLPGLATVAFYNVLYYWNDSINAIYFLDTSSKIVPISIYITRITQYIVFLQEVKKGVYVGVDLGGMEVPESTMIYAVAVVTSLPMLMVFSFFQRYFVGGLTTGGVKG
ncbi:MAG: carbohydrate ABC transporter permease [Christensenellales bacterium]